MSVLFLAILLRLCVTTTALSQEFKKSAAVDSFTGDFILAGATGDLRFDRHDPHQPVLQVAQTSEGFKVTRTRGQLQEIMVLPLDGSAAQYTDMNGHPTSARLKISGNHLQIIKNKQSQSEAHSTGHWSISSTDHWSMSKDGKVLKICGSATSDIRGIVQFTKSGCQIFKRK